MRLPVTPDFQLPLRLHLPDAASLLLETKQHGREEAIGLLNYLVLAWLAHAPAGGFPFPSAIPSASGRVSPA